MESKNQLVMLMEKYQVENMYEKKQRIVRKKGGRERVKKKK